LFCSFNGVALKPVGIDSMCLRMVGEHRLNNACAHFDGLLHGIVKPRLFQRREKIMQRTGIGLNPDQVLHEKYEFFLAFIMNFCGPFTVPSIEQENPVAFAHAQDMGKIVELILVSRDLCAVLQIIFDEEPLNFEICSHQDCVPHIRQKLKPLHYRLPDRQIVRWPISPSGVRKRKTARHPSAIRHPCGWPFAAPKDAG